MPEIDYNAMSDDELFMIQCQEAIPVYDEYYEVEGEDDGN